MLKVFVRSSVAVAALLVGNSAFAETSQQCLGFEDTLILAVQQAPEVEAAQAGIAQAEATLQEARSLRRPQLSGFGRSAVGDNGLTSNQNENQFGLRLSQRIIDFGDSRLAIEAARADVEQRGHIEQAQRLSAAQTVAEAYLMRLEAEAMIKVTTERRAYFTRQRDAVDSLLAEGGATRAESAQIAAELAQAEADMLELQFSADRAATRISEYTGEVGALCGVNELEESVGSIMSGLGSVDDAVTLMLSYHPDIAARRGAIRNLEAQRDRERRSRLPVVELVGIVSYVYNDNRDDWDARDRLGVDVSVPLYTGNAIGARRDRADARLVTEENALRAQQRNLREETRIAFRRQLSLQAQLVRLEAVADNQGAYFDAIAGEFEFGLGTLPDLVEARLAFERAQMDVVGARFALLNEQIRLLQLTASLTNLLGKNQREP